MKYLKTFEGFVDPEDYDLQYDYDEIASVISEEFKKDDIKIKEKIYYDKITLIMDIEILIDIKPEEEDNFLSKVKTMLMAFNYDEDYKCTSVKIDGKFKVRITEK